MKLYCIVYQTGGKLNSKWHRTLAMSRDDADATLESVKRMGYACMLVDYEQSLNLGLPE